MTSATLQNEIEGAVSKLLTMAKELTWNYISSNCKFILSEINDKEENVFRQWQLTRQENERKKPLSLEEALNVLQQIYEDIYDINLHIYKSSEKETVIDIRYFLKSSLDIDFRQKVRDKPPMLHSKVAIPPWLIDRNKKFDLNWQHKRYLWRWKTFWALRKLKRPGR